ncbi:MAG: metallophosphoesterase [Planctomycetota bacterium]
MLHSLSYNLFLTIWDVIFFLICRKNRHPRSYFGALFCFLPLSFGSAFFWRFDIFDLLRLFSWAVFLHFPLLILLFAFLCRRSFRRLSILGFFTVIVFFGIWLDAFWIEPFWLEVTSYNIRSEKIKTPLKIVVLADLQTDYIGSYEKEVLNRVMAEAPQIILLPGDFIQAEPSQQVPLCQELNHFLKALKFQAPQGVYAVEGNTDEASWPLIFEKLPVTVFLKTETILQEEIAITGLTMRDSFMRTLQISSPDSKPFHLVFGHAPDFALGSIDADLLVAGHTHGGQVQIPGLGPLMTFSSVPRSWASGKTDLGNGRTLIVSRGIGMERHHAPRLRFFCRPQLVIIYLLPKE